MYNFVFYNDSFKELDRLFFLDIEDYSNVKIVKRDRLFRSKLLNFLCKLHLSHRVNKKINLPFKWIWNKTLFKNDFSDNDKLCFVFTPGWYYPEFIEYLKKRYKSSKFVFYFSDTIESKLKVMPSLDITYLKENFDLVLSYNQQDVEKYNLKYTSIYYSKMPQSWLESLPRFDQVDVLFIGAARNRLVEIKRAYDKLTNAGLNCYFYVVSNSAERESDDKGIYYSTKGMPFKEYLGRTLSTKSILEILDTNTAGSTLRFWESVMYDKKLITNYPYVQKSMFYNPLYMHYFSSVDEIEPSFISKKNQVRYNYKGENSPVRFLELIENYLAENK
ncbi:hypothetical protein [Paenibacillus sp. sgz302251]|uniref:hypothetical protein n=1 Tax=Paenibacillus sp. sgz302251 TaxID=3414493 RepID=UPI003C7E3B3B